ncbi:uncharacterized protein N0V89_006220 [Didymosphaeria variabile]|uniref:Uncharacterized protein n=1 Tax=Didymosphaeria variabile TaxID=1932322 RepID=A0A9W8XPD3_9PLEO|nr:uncharacterized protein N0V89_006220 [Didymosphaeria variabile]KAJ4354483.1 hypothetical protein N0V89_006220 [Didymosphaeria variabile]
MGNLCGKSSKEDNFQGAGRTLASAPTPATKASIPASAVSAGGPSAKPKVTGPGRTVGGAGGSDGAEDPKAAAAAAAEVRSVKPKNVVKPMTVTAWIKPVTGDLAKKLDEQKKQTRNQTLQQAAYENRAQRDADAATETRNYN